MSENKNLSKICEVFFKFKLWLVFSIKYFETQCYYFKIIENLVFHLFTHIFFGNHHLAVIFQWSKTSYSCLVGIFPWSCISPIEWEFPLNNAFFPKKDFPLKF